MGVEGWEEAEVRGIEEEGWKERERGDGERGEEGGGGKEEEVVKGWKKRW